MSWKKILFVYNPVSGKSLIRNHLFDIIEILSNADYDVMCYPTKRAGDARRIVREREDDFLYVVCAGGDGTLDEVVSGMMESPAKPFVPIGYIPAGSTNDFAANLQIPSNMEDAARIVASGKVFRCDLGQFNDTDIFTYVAAFGLFTDTSYQTPQQLKNQLGHLAYILQGLSSLSKIKSYLVRVTANGKTIESEYAYGMVSNSKSVGGFAGITGEGVDISDGLFEASFIRLPRNPIELNSLIHALNTGNLEECSLIDHFQADRITVESDERIAWTRDGEYGGAHKSVDLVNLKHALKIIVPQSFGGSIQVYSK